MVLFAIVGISGCITSDTQTFSNHGISFNYPANWTQLSPDQVTTDTVAYVYDPTDNKTLFTVRLLNSATAGVNLNSLSDASNSFKTFNQNLTGFKVISENPVTINGLNGQEFVYTFYSTYAGYQKQNKAVILEKTPGSTYYFLVGETASQYYKEFSPTFDKIINSFKG